MTTGGLWGRRFGVLLALLVVAGAGLRIAYVLAETQGDHGYYDALFYELEARTVATGHGWVQPLLLRAKPPIVQETAEHPPATVVALLPAAFIGDADTRDLLMRFTMVAIGCGTIVLVGLIGRSLAGPGAGLVAAAIAVLDPNLWMNDGILMSEALATLVAAALILLGYRAWRGDASWKVAVELGGLCAVGMLTRSELMFFLPLLVIPVLVVGSRRTTVGWGWLAPVAISVVAFGLVLAPWLLFNQSRFEEPATFSTTAGLSLRAANCDAVYSGPNIGLTGILEPACVPVLKGEERSVYDARLRRMGIDYITSHLDRLPVVTAARLGRAFYLFKVDQTIDATHPEGRPLWAEWLGAIATWILLPLSVLGFWTMGRRRIPRWPLMAPLVAVASSFVLVAGLPRYRAAAEPTLIVLTAIAVTSLVARFTGSADTNAPEQVRLPAHQHP